MHPETRSLSEPAGALALAGLKQYITDNKLIGADKKFVVVVSGANINFSRLRFVAERAELGEGREALFTAEIPEERGRFAVIYLLRLSSHVVVTVSLLFILSYIPVQSLSSATDITAARPLTYISRSLLKRQIQHYEQARSGTF